jgi:hypothetical protein
VESHASDMKFKAGTYPWIFRSKLQPFYSCKITKIVTFESDHSICFLNVNFEIPSFKNEKVV